MQCAVINKYGPAAEVFNVENIDIPEPRKNEVLIRQHASSVNPIDFRMRDGYGRVILSKMRGFELPLILGRDVSGEVVKAGPEATGLRVGDAVFGVPGPKAQGAYAEYVISSPHQVVHMPQRLSFEQAAALPYVACTVWDALVMKAGLGPESSKNKKVFVQGGAGGIGSLAIQLLKSWGAYVATTCSPPNMERVAALGADSVINYTSENYAARLSGFDVALETVGGQLEQKTLEILRKDGKGVFVTLVHPMLPTFDEFGLVKGAFKNLSLFCKGRNHARKMGVRRYYWSTFKPSLDALNMTRTLVEEGKVTPHIDHVYGLNEIVDAHEYCEQGKASGKVIIRIGCDVPRL